MQYPKFVTLKKTNNRNYFNKNIYWQKLSTKIGNLFIEEENGYITKITFDKSKVIGKMQETPLLTIAKTQIFELINGSRKDIDIKLKVYASEFEIKVLKELLKIPYGKTKSYLEIAKSVGHKNARAVGNACGKNPIALAIPCHRVIKSDGTIGGFAGGNYAKEYLINLEKVHMQD